MAAMSSGGLGTLPIGSVGIGTGGHDTRHTSAVRSRKSASQEALAEGVRPETRAGRPQDAVLDLQRQLGNTAVTRLVQRDTAASTDAPGAHHGKQEKKKPASDVHARVLRFSIDDGKGFVMMSAGTEQGVQVGMEGALLDEKGEYADFTVEKVGGATCEAHVSATQDQVSRGGNAIIKASKFESQEGKEF
jgi:hypothetical protein